MTASDRARDKSEKNAGLHGIGRGDETGDRQFRPGADHAVEIHQARAAHGTPPAALRHCTWYCCT